jgi:hypothetical protein
MSIIITSMARTVLAVVMTTIMTMSIITIMQMMYLIHGARRHLISSRRLLLRRL